MEKRKILIVEDEVVVGIDLQAKLTKLGFEVTKVVRHGEKALDAAARENPDLVLMDIRLKGVMDGIEAAALIWNRLGIPVVFLTAYADDKTLSRAIEVIPFGYLKKPIMLEELRISLEVAMSKAGIERQLRQSELRYRTVADFTYDWETWLSPEGHYLYISPSCQRITGYSRQELLESPGLLPDIVHPLDREKFQDHVRTALSEDTGFQQMEFRIVRQDGEQRWIEHFCQPVHSPDGKFVGRRASNRDISVRKKLEQERETLIEELKMALSEVKKLSGLLPICASCKKIRDDKGYWNQIETYISARSEAQFSHGLCPECTHKLYPEMFPLKPACGLPDV
jgi:PAS domain S-box-containing protein